MKNKSVKLLCMLVLAIVVIFVFVACGNGDDNGNGDDVVEDAGNGDEVIDDEDEDDNGEDDGDEVAGADGDAGEITVWAWDPNFNIRALDIAAEAFAGVNPNIQVNIVEMAQDDVISQLNTMLPSGSEVGLPNVVLIEDYRAQVFLRSFPGMFYPLDAYINPSDFSPYKIPMTSLDGSQYAVPFDTGVSGFFVRVDVLEEAGFSVDDVTNIDWEELIAIAIEVRDETGVPMLTVDPSDLAIIRQMLQTAGLWYTHEDGLTPYIADNEGIAIAFDIFARLINEGISVPVNDWGGFVGAFNAGDVWSVPTGNWITASVMSAQEQSGDWAVVPFPRMPGMDAINATNLGGSSWYVVNIDGREAGAEFLAATFGSNVDFYVELLNEIGAMGTYMPAANAPEFDQEVEFFGGQRIFSDFAQWASEIPEVNFGLHTYAIEDILANAMQDFLGGDDIQTVLDAAQSQADSQLGQ